MNIREIIKEVEYIYYFSGGETDYGLPGRAMESY